MEIKYKFLDPLFLRIPGVKLFFEKGTGKKDAKNSQICKNNDGHTTPAIDSKVSSVNSKVNKIYLKTTRQLNPLYREANALIIEANTLNKQIDTNTKSNEGLQRQGAMDSSKIDKIIKRLAEIKVESDMVNEMLLHYEERANGILYARISKYWSGILAVTSDELEHFPCISKIESPAKSEYYAIRSDLMAKINTVIYRREANE